MPGLVKISLLKSRWLMILAAFTLLVTGSFHDPRPEGLWNENTPVYEVLKAFGEADPNHVFPNINQDMIARGKELAYEGRTTREDGKYRSRISKYFVCTDCHNTKREDPVLPVSDPEARLAYVIENQMSFLQATTFWGAVNRESWYNGDYDKKYGELAELARKDMREAIQLCATECSQGRLLDEWEMESMLAYFWSLQLRLGDLGLSKEEMTKLVSASSDPSHHTELKPWLKTKYLTASPAHFYAYWMAQKASRDFTGDANRGQQIYEAGCLHCHSTNGTAHFILNQEKLTFGMLERHLFKEDRYSIYRAVRKGTYAVMGYRPYMPQYTLDKMSHQQLEDLRAFIQAKAGE